ncbi:hypothetical protein CVT26_013404, partial [Gymnopilus dilepis]
MANAQHPTLAVEQSIYASIVLSSVLYGLLIYMVFHSYYILKGLAEDDFRWRQFYIYYGFIQLFLVTLRSALNAVTGQLMWIDHRNVSGGPFAYYITLSGNWYGISVVICAILSFALTDALLIYRCYIIWNCDWRIIVLPTLLFIGEIVMGILVPVEIAITKISFLQKSSTNLSVPWVSLTCALTTSITGLI